jgi:hypothetical protein
VCQSAETLVVPADGRIDGTAGWRPREARRRVRLEVGGELLYLEEDRGGRKGRGASRMEHQLWRNDDRGRLSADWRKGHVDRMKGNDY